MRVLITGGSGFIGSHLAEHFSGIAEVRVLDNFRTGHRSNLDGLNAELIEGSITDRDVVRAAVRDVDYVFHLAAMVSVPESMTRIIECVDMNVHGLVTVLEESAAAGVKKLVFSSSAAVYGDNPSAVKLESMTPDPKSPYAITKLDGEYYCRMFCNEGRLKAGCARYFNVFGPRQDPKGAYAAAVPIFIHRALRGEDLIIHGDGEQTRDFVYVKDVAAANAHLAMEDDRGDVYNVAGGQSISINGLAEEIVRLTGSSSRIVHESVRSGDVRHSLASVEKLAFAGFRAKWNFDDALAETIEYFRSVDPAVMAR
ncbi:SDR family NAD(P)-dependent oxidoreductase [soil metagenome]